MSIFHPSAPSDPLGPVFPVRALIEWFASAARDLPWRRTRDPYAVWISEVMLQQTQVKTVIPFWERWMRALPDVAALAAAPEPVLLKLWEGLGYYSRARNLRRAAVQLVEKNGGALPWSLRDWLELPGVGPYTAGAIVSIAGDAPAPAVDGNAIRVITRYLALAGNPRAEPLSRRLWSVAADWGAAADRMRNPAQATFARPCSALTQAIMELGATVCLAASPLCRQCPLSAGCRGFKGGAPERFPELPARPIVRRLAFAVAILRRDGRWFVQQRPAGGINGQMWEFPQLPIESPAAAPDAIVAWLGRNPGPLKALPTIRHSITHHRITLYPYAAELAAGAGPATQGQWATSGGLAALPLAAAHRRLAAVTLAAV